MAKYAISGGMCAGSFTYDRTGEPMPPRSEIRQIRKCRRDRSCPIIRTAMTDEAEIAHRSIDRQRVMIVAPVAVAAPNDVDCVVHNLETGITYRLNDVGARVWELLEMGNSIDDITATIRGEYGFPDDVAPAQVADDVSKVVTDLHQFGLVVPSDPDRA